MGEYGEDIKSQLAQLKTALKESEDRYLSLYYNNHLIMMLIDPESGDIVDANPAACNFYGYTKEEMTGKKIFDINMLNKAEVLEKLKRAVKEKRNYFHFVHRLKNGEPRNVEVYSGPITIGGRQVLYSIIHDITDKVMMEKSLVESEQHYRSLLELAPYCILVYYDYKIVFANQTAAQMLEAEESQLIGLNVLDLFPPEYRETARKRIKNVLINKAPNSLMEYTLLTLKGKPIYVEARSNFFLYKGKPAVQTIFIDITERKKELERAARIQRQRLSTEFPLKDKGKLEVIYKPANFISGDFFHFYQANDHQVVGLLGDVMGKGIAAALCNSALKVLFYDIVGKIKEPAQILDALNKETPKYLDDNYVAACCFSFDFKEKTCQIAAAGISHYSVKSAERYFFDEIITGSFLGMFKDSCFESKNIHFKKGDVFYFYTDGLENLFGQSWIKNKFASFDTIKEQKKFINNLTMDNQALDDDLTWLAVEIL
ncbi:MAG: PAS domain S-box protein [Clostridia bacterium]|nr:PAS domain S-box protein [Clostridia bacterium]